MTNLADLLPAGGGQNNTEFVADGNISAGAPVILTSDGKAAAIGTVAGSVGTEAVFESAYTYNVAMTYDSSQNKVVIIYADNGNSNYGTAVVGTVSDTSISFGTPVVFESASTQNPSICFDSNANKSVLFFRGSSNYMRSIVGTVSGTSISFGSVVNVYTASVNTTACCFDSSVNKVLAVYNEGGVANKGVAIVGTVSGTSISFGSTATFESGAVSYLAASFDSTENKNVIVFVDDDDSSKAKAIVASISGTTIGSWGTEVTFYSSSINYTDAVYDSNAAKTVISYRVQSGSYQGEVVVATVSGHTISFGTAVESHSGNSNYNKLAFDSDNNNILIVFRDGNDGGYIKFKEGTVSGTSITFSTATNLTSAASDFIDCCYDTGSDRLVVGFSDDANSNYGTGVVAKLESSTLTSTNLLGLAPEAISDTATGTINTWGSRCESSNLLADSLSLASADTTSGNTNKENVSVAYDSNADRTILVYRDGGDSDKLKCIIGTLSGTSTSWGTAVEIVGATAGNRGTAVVYDSNAQRVLIAYTKADTYAYVRVGEISGTSVTLGTEVAASSSNSYYPELSYDVADQKVLLVFANAGDNYYPYSAACTITAVGNSVAVTTPASVASRNAYDPFGLAYNANDGKHVLDITDNSSTGYAYVLTMSSGSISVGAEASYSPGFTPRQSFCVYDSSAQKIVRGYYSNSDPRPVEFAVASISGTNVSFGTAVTAFSGNGGRQVSGTFYSSINQIALFNLPFATSSLETNFGTVSGTTITFGTATTVASSGVSSTSYFDMTYDSTAQKLIYAYRATTFDAVVGSFGTTPLTVTSDYYVQTDGTLSTDTGGQLIGNAIKTNQINIKDYTG